MERNDTHRPAEMNPTEYRLVAFLEPEEIENEETGTMMTVSFLAVEDHETWGAYLSGEVCHWSGTQNPDPRFPSRCDHCGAHYKYASWFIHEPTGEMIAVGRTCAENRFGSIDWSYRANIARTASHFRNGLQILRDGEPGDGELIADYLEFRTRLAPYRWEKRTTGEFLLNFDSSAAPEQARNRVDWRIDAEYERFRIVAGEIEDAGGEVIPMTFAEKQTAKALRWHREKLAGAEASLYSLPRKLSLATLEGDEPPTIAEFLAAIDKYESALLALRVDLFQKVEVKAGEIEIGRALVTAKVLSTKYVETQYGYTEKMLIELPNGARAYGSVPSAINAESGAQIEFSAEFERSHDDPSFGFFKRPTKARILAETR